jgi:hypothetical protein
VIDVGMGEHDGIELPRLNAQLSIDGEGFLPPALEESAVEQHCARTRPNDVLRARNGSRGAYEFDFQPAPRPFALPESETAT